MSPYLKLNLSIVYSNTNQHDRATALNQEVVASARRLKYDDILSFGLQHSSRNHIFYGRWDDVMRDAEEGIDAARRTGNQYILFGLLMALYEAESALKRFDASDAIIAELRMLANEFGSAWYHLEIDLCVTQIALGRGLVADTLAHLVTLGERMVGLEEDDPYLRMTWLRTAANTLIAAADDAVGARLYGYFERKSQALEGDFVILAGGVAHQTERAMLRARLGDRFDALIADGAALDDEQAFTLARERITAALARIFES
ncbi:MAG: hypothetical protein SGJ24_08780 [Chloroflexota bacterium]|nr:hypothetical protein [Chloroflexota bacterium]